jgi:hypothetical protein
MDSLQIDNRALVKAARMEINPDCKSKLILVHVAISYSEITRATNKAYIPMQTEYFTGF